MNTIRQVQAISIYDRSGMIQVAGMTKDFAPTSNGARNTASNRFSKKSDASDFDFENELERAMLELNEIKRPA